jgi:large subunit ribosomal protein L10
MNKTEKQQIVEELSRTFREKKNVLLINFTGLNVADVTELRRRVRPIGVYRVVKNTMALLAAEGTPVENLKGHFEGPTAIAYTETDPVALAKVLTEFVRDHPGMSFKSGLLDQNPIFAEQIEDLAKVPSQEELWSRLVFLLNAPLRGLATALQLPLVRLGVVLKELEKRKKEGTN